jgi:4-azaleucine resistance transporter AzlC
LQVQTYEIKQHVKGACFSAFPYTIPMLTSVTVLGMTYGVLMQSKGYGVLWSTLMSAIAFCGSMQFAAMALLTTAFMPAEAFILSFLVNARHIFYGIPMLNKFKGTGKIRGFLIYVLCDETFSMFCTNETPAKIERKYFYFWISFFVYLYWVVGTFLGGLLGNFMTFNLKGLDFAMTALFLVMFLEQLEKKGNRRIALIGFGCTIINLFIFGEKNFIIPSMILMVLVLMSGRKKLCS